MAMTDSPRLAVVAGSFDPVTCGHIDLFTRAQALFPRVVVAVLSNPAKQPLFTVEDRVAMLREAVDEQGWAVEIDTFDGLLSDYVRRRGASAIVRGLRTAGEFSYESPIALMNRHLQSTCETVFVVPGAGVTHISSTLVREIASLHGPVDGLVPAGVAARLAQRFARS